MTQTPICFECEHFRQYQPLPFITPGECRWEPLGDIPDWLQTWLDTTDNYYGPKREVSTRWPVLTCQAFKETPK